MKKIIFLLLASGSAFSAMAQDPSPMNTSKKFAPDSLLSHWVVDINLLGGGVMQDLTMAKTIGNYNNAISGVSNMGKLTIDQAPWARHRCRQATMRDLNQGRF